MSYVYGVAFTLIGILISLPGLLIALNLLFPDLSERAYLRLTWTPVMSFIIGLPVVAVFAVWIGVAADGGATAIAISGTLLALLLWSIGSAGLSRVLAERIQEFTGQDTPLPNLLRGTIILELAMLTPFIGWFLFLPLTATASIGASVFALIRWIPKRKIEKAALSAIQQPVSITDTQPGVETGDWAIE